jgi:hypothetical protein
LSFIPIMNQGDIAAGADGADDDGDIHGQLHCRGTLDHCSLSPCRVLRVKRTSQSVSSQSVSQSPLVKPS